MVEPEAADDHGGELMPLPERQPGVPLCLRPLALDDERQARAAHLELGREGFGFLLGFQAGDAWDTYLAKLEAFRTGEALPEHWVPAVFLVAVLGDRVIGRVSIRFELNDALRHHGGHIGYAVRPAERRRGYATEMLSQSLIVVRAAGIGRVLVTCDDDNVASVSVIERHGGVLEDVRRDSPAAEPWRRYWID